MNTLWALLVVYTGGGMQIIDGFPHERACNDAAYTMMQAMSPLTRRRMVYGCFELRRQRAT